MGGGGGGGGGVLLCLKIGSMNAFVFICIVLA